MTNPLLDIRIGTMVKGNLADPAAYVRQILPLGFESIQPFFWQTLGGKDIPRLAGEIREAIGDADVVVGAARHVRQSARGRRPRPRDARGLGDADRQRAPLRHRHASPASPAGCAASRCPTACRASSEVWGAARPARRRQGRAHRLRELRDGRQLGERRLEHRPQPGRLGADVRRAARRQPRARVGALPPDGLPDRPDPADPQMGAEDLPRARQGRDDALGRDPRARHLRQAAVRADAHARLRRQRLDARDQRPAARRLQGRRSTSRAGTTRSTATRWR